MDSYVVRVEARVTAGVPSFVIVGLADSAVREGKERVRSALRPYLPEHKRNARVVVNLSPAWRRKAGASYDLAIAAAVLIAAEQLAAGAVEETVLLGELGLDGRLLAVAGVLPALLEARRRGFRRAIVPDGNATEAGIVEGLKTFAVGTIEDALALLRGVLAPAPVRTDARALLRRGLVREVRVDLAEVRGQQLARRALEIAAAGDHHLLMIGPPGAGKTMLARRMTTILPPFELDEAIETTSIHSIAGLNRGGALLIERPFRAPHHSTSAAGMVGGGPYPAPGEISLAHNGVLFLDELPEFAPSVLNQLREPLEEGSLTVCRAAGRLRFPARFTLIAAMNPCPCGFFATDARPCTCAELAIRRYRARVSGPLLDRIDLFVNVPRVDFEDLEAPAAGETSARVRERVMAARALRARHPTPCVEIASLCAEPRALLQRACERMNLSARAATRIVRIAQTIAYLSDRNRIETPDVAEALQFRRDTPSMEQSM